MRGTVLINLLRHQSFGILHRLDCIHSVCRISFPDVMPQSLIAKNDLHCWCRSCCLHYENTFAMRSQMLTMGGSSVNTLTTFEGCGAEVRLFPSSNLQDMNRSINKRANHHAHTQNHSPASSSSSSSS
mmetsp:Transcript_41473/g.60677  ORF Transcript_41473/g.60677 Transcript_41473/m.60677 type:complete len:128 (+) Transcript_41473:425-808(+)